jgi:hypothetical protein
MICAKKHTWSAQGFFGESKAHQTFVKRRVLEVRKQADVRSNEVIVEKDKHDMAT